MRESIEGKEMRILHLLYESKHDYFGIGGVGIRAYEIYKYLKDRHDITLLCKKYPGAQNREIERLRHIFAGTESKSLTKTLLSYAFQAALFVKRNGDEFDIIIEEFSPAIPTFLNLYKKRPVVLQIQGYTGKQYFGKYNIAYALFLYTLEHLRPMFYDNFIFVNQETQKKLLPKSFLKSPLPPFTKGGCGGITSSKGVSSNSKGFSSLKTKRYIELISNGVSPELLTISPDEGDYILYLGRIDIHHKGLDILLTAYKEFRKTFASVRLVIAGDGRDIVRFKMLLDKLPDGVKENIELSGWVSDKVKEVVLKNALFAVFPSRYEVQPIAVLEAMACGKAVIVSDISELSYVIKNKAGISFKTGDSISLGQSMKDLMTSNERKEMGQRGRAYVKDFTWDSIALQYEKFLLDVSNQKGNGVHKK
ncbi:MAG: hypothetical protein A2Y66_02695 [Nitrospirae bacterium RBG_13_41_22]|nr:MAG: hypothetical protein A2Y66_02695 [Nitrospirae bacterium RBG_13_41_22]